MKIVVYLVGISVDISPGQGALQMLLSAPEEASR